MSSPAIDLGELPALLTPKQLSALLDKSTDALANERYFRRGIPCTKVGSRVYYLRSDIVEFLAAHRHCTEQDPPQ